MSCRWNQIIQRALDYTDTRDSVIIVPIEKFDKLDVDEI